MKKNYFSYNNSNAKKTVAVFKIMLLTGILFICSGVYNYVSATATISLTSAIGTDAQSLCINIGVTNITYAVGGTGTGAGVTGLPAGLTGSFSSGTYTINGTPSASGIFNYTVTTTGSGSQVTATGTITVHPIPTLSSTLTPPPTCSGAAFNYTPTSSISGATFTWTRAVVTGISNIAASGTDTVNEILINTTTVQINVTYVYTVSADGCTSTQNIVIAVNPTPTLSSSPTPAAICSGTAFSYNPTSFTAGAVFVWTRALILGISNVAGSGTLNPNETLINTTSAILNVTYVYTVTANACSSDQNVVVAVNPTPLLTSSPTPSAICSGAAFSYNPTSSTAGAVFAWTRALVAGISNAAGSGTINPNETLINTTGAIVNVTYVYTITANACSSDQNIVVAVNPLPALSSTLSPPPTCSGAVFSYQPTSITAGATFVWSRAVVTSISNVAASGTGNPNETLVNITTAPVSVTYIYSVVANSCTNPTDYNVVVTINPPPIADAGPDKTICFGDTAILSGTGGITYLWTDGTNSSTNPTLLASPTATSSYTLTVTNNIGCTATDIAIVSVTPSKDIYGHAAYSGGNVTNGNVVIYRHKAGQSHFDSIQVVSLNSSGNYHFTGINHGNYLVKIFADTISYPTLIPTYYGNAFLWNDPSVIIIHQNCAVSDTLNNTTMTEVTGTGGGIGLLIGQIIEGAGFGRAEGEPIPGVDVKLGKNPGGSLAATSTTNATGHYTFSGVAFGSYTIYADIPGLGRDSSFTFTVDSVNNQFVHLDYTADSSSINITPNSSTGISNHASVQENKFRVYPNPVKGNTNIEYSISQPTDAKITLDVYNVLGEKIKSIVNASQPAGTYKYNLNPQSSAGGKNCGVYFIRLTIDGKTTTKRIIVLE